MQNFESTKFYKILIFEITYFFAFSCLRGKKSVVKESYSIISTETRLPLLAAAAERIVRTD